ncbi:g11097 [Coccomyxa elongata]
MFTTVVLQACPFDNQRAGGNPCKLAHDHTRMFTEKGALNFAAGHISGVHNAAVAVAAFARQVQCAVLLACELRP